MTEAERRAGGRRPAAPGVSRARPGGRERVVPGGGAGERSAGRGEVAVLSGREGTGGPGARKGVRVFLLFILPTITPPPPPSRVRAGCGQAPFCGTGWGNRSGECFAFLFLVPVLIK